MPVPSDAEDAGCARGLRMNCQQVQINLSLYLYGELEFAQEETLEEHLDQCAFCQRALAREKEWHGALNAEQADVPLSLLAECRQDLRHAVGASRSESSHSESFRSEARGMPSWRGWLQSAGLRGTRWSLQIAAASFLLFAGFGAGRVFKGDSWPMSPLGEMSLAGTHVRDIQPDGANGVRLTIDRVIEREISGRVDDGEIRSLLLSAVQDPSDPGIRVYCLEMLKGQQGGDIRDTLLNSARSDSNAAVRLKALEGIRQFPQDSTTLETLKYVLEHDEDPGVRSEAIDMLALSGRSLRPTADLAVTLQEIMRSEHGDDYVRTRCLQMLREMNAPLNVY